ncbi:hypothetical protein HYU19_04905 [Candidatus Woesearchaeota archaeon]|nr:hypothetical protein [Candidatus Woesearchaeota archaeon]
MTSKCPKCRSSNVAWEDYQGIPCITCQDCGFDERNEYDIAPEEKTSQQAKGSYMKYKTGGSRRTQK